MASQEDPKSKNKRQSRVDGRSRVKMGNPKTKQTALQDDDEEFAYLKDSELKMPEDQEKLTEDQLDEIIERTLSSIDPMRPRGSCYWNPESGDFELIEMKELCIRVFHKDSELQPKAAETLGEYQKFHKTTDVVSTEEIPPDPHRKRPFTIPVQPPPRKPPLGKRYRLRGRRDKDDDDEDNLDYYIEEPTLYGTQKTLLNQFRFVERPTQCHFNTKRSQGTQTPGRGKGTFEALVNQWTIYDAYEDNKEAYEMEQYLKAKAAAEALLEEEQQSPEYQAVQSAKAAAVVAASTSADDDERLVKDGAIEDRERTNVLKESQLAEPDDAQHQPDQPEEEDITDYCVEALRKLERLVMQNLYSDVVDDFKFYEDGADELRENGEGSLLPLWKFQYDRVKKHHVTDISWSRNVPDMYAVSFGSYNYTSRVKDGFVVVYSLRNCAFPEQVWNSPRGCMGVDIHPKKNNLIAVALYDGNVAILILKEDEENEPQSEVVYNIPTQMKHLSHAWNIKWNSKTIRRQPNFYSSGTDGRIIHWTLESPDVTGLGGLFGTEIALYKIPTAPILGPDGYSYTFTGCAQLLTFHPRERTSYLIGTSEGSIFVCSVTYGSRFFRYYRAHHTPLTGLSWNAFHPDVFISSSEDWTIKIWDRKDPEPMYVFDVGSPVMDVQWAPYSSTVFAVAMKDGRVMVYDLNVNKYDPIACQQVVIKKAFKLLRLRFNPYYPIIVVGDSRGELNTLKLSPNCRIVPRDDDTDKILRGEPRLEFEVNKIKKILSLVRDSNVKKTPHLGLPKLKNSKQIKTMQEIIEEALAEKKDVTS